MRVPPNAGPSTVLWIAMMAFRPASLLWQNTTCSWPKVSKGFKDHRKRSNAGRFAHRERRQQCVVSV
jgi:hypothetical protein